MEKVTKENNKKLLQRDKSDIDGRQRRKEDNKRCHCTDTPFNIYFHFFCFH